MAASELSRAPLAGQLGSPFVFCNALSSHKHAAHRPPQSAPSFKTTSKTAVRLRFSSNPLLKPPVLCATGDLKEKLVSKRRQRAITATAAVNGTTFGPDQVQTVADHGGRNGAHAGIFIQPAERPASRSAQLPSYAEFVEPTSALGLPSRTTWSSVRLPTSLFELSEAIASESFWEVISSPQAAGHAAYFAARTAYFVGQTTLVSSLLGSGAQPHLEGDAMLQDTSAATRLILGSILELHRMDQENVRWGIYRPPFDMDLRHRQWNPLFWQDSHEKLLNTMTRSRQLMERGERKARHASEVARAYPGYYLQHFHWQPGGWLDDQSAQVYEYSTETVFWGAQDMMQRQTLVPLHFFMRGRNPATTSILDLACGTGRFLTFIKDNYPTSQTYGVDLSPNYLKAAEENMDYLQSFDWQVNGHRGLTRTKFIQGNAEEIPFADQSLDVITCVYLFHELPPAARQNVFKEAARVLKPGGIFVWTDSVQKGDAPEMGEFLQLFPQAYHEPYYMSFCNADFKKQFAAAGLSHEGTILAHLSKVMCFRKAS